MEQTTAARAFAPGEERETDPNTAPLHAALQWKTTGVCLDFECGKCCTYGHLDVYGDETRTVWTGYVRCRSCKTVYRCNPRIQLIRLTAAEAESEEHWRKNPGVFRPRGALAPGEDRETDPNPGGLRADLQWKGTKAHLDYVCACGHAGTEEGFFKDHIICAGCAAYYRCNRRIQLIRLTKAEAAEARRLGLRPLVPGDRDDD